MTKHNKKIVKSLGIVFIAYGGFKILLGLKSVWLVLGWCFYPSSYNSISEQIFYSTMTILLTIILPSAAIIGGIGLLKQKKWGWIVAVVIAISTFIMGALGTINFIIESDRYRNMPISFISGGEVVDTISMIPTYIQCIVALIILILLSRKFIKQSIN